MAVGTRHLLKHWQGGDGRRLPLAGDVASRAAPGDVDVATRTIDEFCYGQSIMMTVGDEKGEILGAAARGVNPRRLLELGPYCGYSAVRTVRVIPDDAHLCSIEFSLA